ncbi:glycosyltransferase [uncultured Martelella sp.]|uniref:glycosyltransferase n=1 Tax=uncultured Martelella sp. TaxID=392331 RepID=UPI0029C61001|nr:glycosyltransferase [uncultured Martelella sp.]
MRIMHLIASVDPDGGGPVEYARVMAAEHAKLGHESVFVTLDRENAAFIRQFGFPVFGTGPGSRIPARALGFSEKIAELASNFDVAVVHGLWNQATISGHAALVSAGLPWVIFSHGMLDPWFRKAKPVKHWIKQAYWTLWQGRMLSEASTVLFTCEEECRLARGAFVGHSKYRERVVAFCASDQGLGPEELDAGRASFKKQLPALSGRAYLLFLSRVHPKKACDQLIEAFSRIACDYPAVDLVIAGPDQTGWQVELEAMSARLGVAGRVHWPGPLKGAAKAAAFADAHAFVLPSHQENFGLVVAEALSTGTPVLISTKVNIWREIVKAGAGLAVDDTVDATEGMLRSFMKLDLSTVQAMRAATRPCYDAHFSVQQAAEDLLACLEIAVLQNSHADPASGS